MSKRAIWKFCIAFCLGAYGLLSLSMPTLYAYMDKFLEFPGQLFYLTTGIGFIAAGILIGNSSRWGSALAFVLFLPQVIALETASYFYNFIGPVHLILARRIDDYLVLHINLLAILGCLLMVLNAVVQTKNKGISLSSQTQSGA